MIWMLDTDSLFLRAKSHPKSKLAGYAATTFCTPTSLKLYMLVDFARMC
jgi:hypothetical protein